MLVREFEVAGRLVGQQECRTVHECARDSLALLLAARELIRVVVDAIAEADHLQRLHGAPASLPCGHRPTVQHRQLDILRAPWYGAAD